MVKQHYRWDFIGLSTDTKPTPEESEKVTNGSTFYESDTSKLYVFYQTQWYEKISTGGGGGSYTAGDGIDITNSTISVDTDTIQEKLTAGTGIDITNNTISATGGGGPTVVQTTGTSTTDVMSQNAVTSMTFNDPSAKTQIKIGNGASSNATRTIAIGDSATASNTMSIALGNGATANGERTVALGVGATTGNNFASVAIGAQSLATRSGEVNIGTGNYSYGYNSTAYRVLGGVHDGIDVHDAATVGQVNSVIDAINTALSTNIPHIGS